MEWGSDYRCHSGTYPLPWMWFIQMLERHSCLRVSLINTSVPLVDTSDTRAHECHSMCTWWCHLLPWEGPAIGRHKVMYGDR